MHFFYHKVFFSDLETLLWQTKSWNLDFRQLDSGEFRGHLIQYGVPNAQIGIGMFGRKLDQRGGAPQNQLSFAILGERGTKIVWRREEVDHNKVMVYQPGDEIDCSSEPGFNVVTYSVSIQVFEKHCQAMGLPELISIFHHQKTFPVSAYERTVLLEKVAQVNLAAARAGDQIEKETIRNILEFEFLHLLIQVIAKSVSMPGRSPLTARTHKALVQIEQSLKYSETPPVTVQDLCAIAGVSERTLQNLFQWKYGIPPMSYLKRVRLNDVRKVLYHEKPGRLKITDIANRRGFWHMGQFAKDYKQLFGELPSDTLRKT